MQKENLMESVASVGTPAPVETPASGLAAAPDLSVPAAIPAVCVKTVTRLDALKEYVLGYMDTERFRNANLTESGCNDLRNVLDEAEQVLSDLRRIAGRAGLENGIAERETAAAFLELPDSGPEALTPDNAVFDAIVANRKKIVTRLDALKEYVLSYMDVECRDANPAEINPDNLPYMLEEAELILFQLGLMPQNNALTRCGNCGIIIL